MKKEHKFYKICWSVPQLAGLYSAWTNIEKATYLTKEEAYEAMKNLADKLCKKLSTTYATMLNQFSYKMIEPTMFECKAPIIFRGVIIQENLYTFDASPVGYLQVFEV